MWWWWWLWWWSWFWWWLWWWWWLWCQMFVDLEKCQSYLLPSQIHAKLQDIRPKNLCSCSVNKFGNLEYILKFGKIRDIFSRVGGHIWRWEGYIMDSNHAEILIGFEINLVLIWKFFSFESLHWGKCVSGGQRTPSVISLVKAFPKLPPHPQHPPTPPPYCPFSKQCRCRNAILSHQFWGFPIFSKLGSSPHLLNWLRERWKTMQWKKSQSVEK